MRAADIMTTDVIAVSSEDSVQSVARVLFEHRISGVPVVDADYRIVGIVSESDLMRRVEIDTEERRSWLNRTWSGRESLAREYVRSHSRKVADVMTTKVITANQNTSLREIASLLEKNGIKRVPIVHNRLLVGIVSRANLVQAIAALPDDPIVSNATDDEIWTRIYGRLRAQHWLSPSTLNVAVDQGVVDVWASVNSEAERKAILVAAQTTPGVSAVRDHMSVGVIPSDY